MEELEGYRRQMDAIDQQLVDLLEQRLAIVLQVGAYKQSQGLEVLQAGREEVVLQQATAQLKNPEFTQEIQAIFQALLQTSRHLQKRQRQVQGHRLSNQQTVAGEALLELAKPEKKKALQLGFPGVAGAFSEEALITFFGEAISRQSYEDFEAVCLALEQGQIDYGILPIENSSTGSVNEVYDLLLKYGFYIIGQQSIPVQHHLLGLPQAHLQDVRQVYSHAQGIAQSSRFLKKHRQWQLIPHGNTATSAKLVKDKADPSKAAIAGSRAAALYGLKVLQSCINDEKDNNTLFIVIGRKPIQLAGANKLSLAFWLENRPGALAKVLDLFAASGINMTKIESRPARYRPWEYVFYADFEGDLPGKQMEEALQQAENASKKLRLLGIYPRYAL